MDFLYKTFEQLRDLWKSMTPSARLASGLMAGVIVVSALWLVRGTPEKSDHSLFGGRELSQNEIAKMVEAFSQANLSGWEVVGNRIHIPGALKHKYMAALAEAKVLPDKPYSDFDDAFSKDSPFVSQSSVKAQFAVAKQKEIARTIMSMRGIENATVIYDESVDRSFPSRKNASAMVKIETKTNEPLDEQLVGAIRNLVVAAYSGLKASNVAVTDAKAGVTHEGPPPEGTAGAHHSLYREEKARTDRDYEAKIRKALAMIPGVQVSASSTLSPQIYQQLRTEKFEPKTVPYRTREENEERQNTTSGPAGVPGAASNGVNQFSQPVAVNSKGDTSKETKSTSESEAHVGKTTMIEGTAPLMATNVTASISVPAKYYVDIWHAANPPVAGQPAKTPTIEEIRALEVSEKKNIENLVEKLLPPVTDGEQSFPRIQVTTYQELPEAPVPAPSTLDWLLPIVMANWQAGVLGVLGLVGVVMLRSMMKTAQPGEAPAPIADEEEAPKENEPPSPGVISQLRERFNTSGPSLREELQELVKEDPEAAANVLRNWIGEAA
jgi:flagellar M-ring protein FliF